MNPHSEFDNKLQLAIKLHQQGDLKQAKVLYKTLLIYDKTDQIHYFLGLLFNQTQRYHKAIYHLEKCAHRHLRNPDWYNAIALAYQKNQQYKPALRFSRIAVSLQPSHPNYLNRYCKILFATKSYERIIELMSAFLKVHPQYAEGHITLALTLLADDKAYAATRCLLDYYRKIKNNANINLNLADALIQIERYKFATKILQELIQNNVLVPESLSQLAIISRENGELGTALNLIEQAYELAPNNPVIQWNLGLFLLLTKQYPKGWSLYDSGILTGQRYLPAFKIPLWKGESIEDKTLLIIGEQGLGDQVMFISQLENVNSLDANILYLCDVRLKSLLKRSFPNITFLSQNEVSNSTLKTCDYKILAGSIFPVLDKLGKSITPKPQFLTARNFENIRSQHQQNKLKIGFAWKGGLKFKEQRKRIIPLPHWKAILANSDAEFYCLQHDIEKSEEKFLDGMHSVTSISSIAENRSIEELCSLISRLGLVITVDNTVAHLAAGLGIETWCLIPFSPDWRWGIEGETSIWYQNLFLYRQAKYKNWQKTLEKVEADLLAKVVNDNKMSRIT